MHGTIPNGFFNKIPNTLATTRKKTFSNVNIMPSPTQQSPSRGAVGELVMKIVAFYGTRR
jgi:hypothetical protein